MRGVAVAAAAAALGVSVVGFSGCSGGDRNRDDFFERAPLQSSATAVRGPGPQEVAAQMGSRASAVVSLSNGARIVVEKRGAGLFYTVEGTYTQRSFSRLLARVSALPADQRKQALATELDDALARLSARGATIISKRPELGYFTASVPYSPELVGALMELKFRGELLLNPVTQDVSALEDVKAYRLSELGITPRVAAGGRDGTAGYSGLERIGAPAFVKLAEADIGEGSQVDGSSVRLGIADSGITLNHPTFRAADGKSSRVVYMRDFTGEGRVYFSPQAAFSAKAVDGSDDEVEVSAQFIDTPPLPARPLADRLSEASGLRFRVSTALKAVLLNPASGARLGFLNETAFNSPADPIDINHNGRLDDRMPMLMVPAADGKSFQVYFDPTATGDFRNAVALGNWNDTRQTVKVYAERVGFDLRSEQLPTQGGSPAEVMSASLVGFDPGNHGTHVAGIAAGSKTISNDPDDTLARGVAPRAQILLNRACSNNLGCNATEAVADLVQNGHADVINLSLGGLSPFNDGLGVQETLINRITRLTNTLLVISAGNSGPGKQTVGSPSVASLALSVGASASRGMIQRQYEWAGGPAPAGDGDDDFVLFFSSRGPTAAGGFKPELVAPGTELSSVQLNAAPGANAGLDVYWGTSMAAPVATGSYALLLDAVRKYNERHPATKLPSTALAIRQAMIEGARPFDMATFDPATGKATGGQYTWVDEGAGIVDLPSAWARLFRMRDDAVPSAVSRASGESVELDYEVIVPQKAANGLAYDGSRAAAPGKPAFGSGLYLDFAGKETLYPVHISRSLPEALAASDEGGDLAAQLETTRDEFALKTTFFGGAKPWLKAGVLDRFDCMGSDTANASVYGEGARIRAKADGTGELVPSAGSAINVCVDRQAIQTLPEGDNGALISGYRMVNGRAAPGASFTIPVYVTVPHRTLRGSTAYEISREVPSLGVSRNYVAIPEGTTVLRIALEVPSYKEGVEGCSGVELMALGGTNVARLYADRKEARVSNCDAKGAPNDSKRALVFTRSDPKPGIWDIHVVGQSAFASSKFKLRVDYVMAQPSVGKIEGGLAALTGSLTWTVSESSVPILPDPVKSGMELDGFIADTQGIASQGGVSPVPGPMGIVRAYPPEAASVTITTGGSPGNDIDLAVLECDPQTITSPQPSCQPVGSSAGPTDEEKVTFKPQAGKAYVAVAAGFTIKESGTYSSSETVTMPADPGTLSIAGTASPFTVSYSLSEDQLAASKLLKSDLFAGGTYDVVGEITLRSSEGMTLGAVPIRVRAKKL